MERSCTPCSPSGESSLQRGADEGVDLVQGELIPTAQGTQDLALDLAADPAVLHDVEV